MNTEKMFANEGRMRLLDVTVAVIACWWLLLMENRGGELSWVVTSEFKRFYLPPPSDRKNLPGNVIVAATITLNLTGKCELSS